MVLNVYGYTFMNLHQFSQRRRFYKNSVCCSEGELPLKVAPTLKEKYCQKTVVSLEGVFLYLLNTAFKHTTF